MGLVKFIGNVATGAIAGVALITALPVAGAVGTITVTGAAVAATVGGVAGVIDHVSKDDDN